MAGSLLAQQCAALGQEPVANTPTSAVPYAAPPGNGIIRLRKNTEIDLLQLETVSSATAAKGQVVRFAVAHDVFADGAVVIPKGATVLGVVKQVERAIPRKRGGRLTIVPQEIVLGNGMSFDLHAYEDPGGGTGCRSSGSCLVFPATALILTPIWLVGVLAFSVVFTSSVFLIGGLVVFPALLLTLHFLAPHWRAHREEQPRPIAGVEMVLPACSMATMFADGRPKRGVADVGGRPMTIVEAMDTVCPARGNVAGQAGDGPGHPAPATP
jgi:hypothetical protein